MRKDALKMAFTFAIAQLSLAVIITGFLVFFSWTAAYSALTGGLIAALSNAWFASKVFTAKGQDDPAMLLRAFYLGEIYKILLIAALFIMVFVLIKPINPVALFISFFMVYMTPAVINLFSGVERDESDNGG